jgi:hypothetical protein
VQGGDRISIRGNNLLFPNQVVSSVTVQYKSTSAEYVYDCKVTQATAGSVTCITSAGTFHQYTPTQAHLGIYWHTRTGAGRELAFKIISAKVESNLNDRFRQYNYAVPTITDDSLQLRDIPSTERGIVTGAFVQGIEIFAVS